jgi:Zn-dependent metalloprotease
MRKLFTHLVLLFSIAAGGDVMAQPTLQKLQEQLLKENSGAPLPLYTIELNNKKPSLGAILFNPSANIALSEAKQWLSNRLALRAGVDELTDLNYPVVSRDLSIYKYQQFFKGIAVENGMINIAGNNGKAGLIQIEFYAIADNFTISPAISNDVALQKAMAFAGSAHFSWQPNNNGAAAHPKPVGKLVIFKNDAAITETVCLAYKFLITGSNPFVNAYVYVDAATGKVVRAKNNMSDYGQPADKYTNEKISPDKITANATGTAVTRYNGTRIITTDDAVSPTFRLRQTTSYNVPIVTLNYESNRYDINAPAPGIDFTDNDNNWTAAEHHNTTMDDAALQVHFSMQVIADYWKYKQGRNSWNGNDGAAGTIKSYIHVGNPNTGAPVLYNNASWDGNNNCMVYGDGQNGAFTTFDISAHEIGHAVMSSLMISGFEGGREPGALSEAFSDIWAACAVNYGNTHADANYNNLGSVWIRGELTSEKRRMDFPQENEAPDTYYGNYFVDATVNGCLSINLNDACGIHTNNAILNKWFYLITNGGTGTNDNGYTYTVTGLGFDKTENIVFNTAALLTSGTDYKTVMNAFINYATFKYGAASNEVTQIKEAWRAVGVLNFKVYTYTNTPVFGTNNFFNSIIVGRDNCVWAGTSGLGLFRYNGTQWEKSPTVLDNKITVLDMKTDKNGGVWMAESGFGGVPGTSNSSGGVFYFEDSSFTSRRYYNTLSGLPSRNARSIFVDTSKNSTNTFTGNVTNFPQVWVATLANTTSSTTTSGAIGQGMNDTLQYDFIGNDVVFNIVNDGINDASGTGGVNTIGGSKNEIWAYTNNNTSPAQQLMQYDANGSMGAAYNTNNLSSIFSAGFLIKAIYVDKNNNRWFGLQTGGIVVKDSMTPSVWYKSTSFTDNYTADQLLSVAELFPAGTIVNNNAIVGDALGRVYIGTSNGLVVYDGAGPVDRNESYRRYSTTDGLPFNNIKSIGIDEDRGGLWLASDNGIAFWGGMDRTVIAYAASSKCPGNLIRYRLAVRGKFFNSPAVNKIVIELSDANGSFASPVLLEETDQYQYNSNPLRSITVPLTVVSGAGYRIRARSTNPIVVGPASAPFSIVQNTFVPSSGAVNLTANRECTDVTGWTHYFFDNNTPNDEVDDIRLLSIKKNGNYIGAVGEGGFSVSAAATVAAGSNTGVSVVNPIITNPIISMNRYWKVVPNAQPTSPVGVRFYYNTQDLLDINGSIIYGPIDHTQLVFYKTDGNPDPTSNLASTTNLYSYVNGPIPTLTNWSYTQVGATTHQAEFLVPGFSGGGGGTTVNNGPLTGPLPLQLLGFTARQSGTSALLQWQTTAEINTSHFEIQRSTDGRQFTTMATVQAAGNSNTQKNYQLNDVAPVNGKNYYRLKMVDLDGKNSYSPVRMINFNSGGMVINIYPNPAKDILNIETNFAHQQLQISITDITGRTMMQWQKQSDTLLQLPIGALANGTYVVQISNGKELITQKLIKE